MSMYVLMDQLIYNDLNMVNGPTVYVVNHAKSG